MSNQLQVAKKGVHLPLPPPLAAPKSIAASVCSDPLVPADRVSASVLKIEPKTENENQLKFGLLLTWVFPN